MSIVSYDLPEFTILFFALIFLPKRKGRRGGNQAQETSVRLGLSAKLTVCPFNQMNFSKSIYSSVFNVWHNNLDVIRTDLYFVHHLRIYEQEIIVLLEYSWNIYVL